MKIGIIIPKFPIFSETFILNQITGLIDRGHEVEILAYNKGDNKVIHDAVKTHKLLKKVTYFCGDFPKNKFKRVIKILPVLLLKLMTKERKKIIESLNYKKYGKNILSLRCLYGVLHNNKLRKYDIIHCQFGTHGIEAVLFKNIGILEGEIVTSLRGFDITSSYEDNKSGYNLLFEQGKLFLPVCKYFKDLLIEKGCPVSKIEVHYSGIDIEKTNKFKMDKLKNRKSDGYNILSTARLEEKKGLEFSIRAVASLIRDGYQLSYNIIGDGSLKLVLIDLIKKLEMENNIFLVGKKNQEEVFEYLNETDLLIAPSITGIDGNKEGIPNALKEAMLMGLPVISTYHGGVPELITHGVSGYLAPEKDSDSIKKNLKYVVDNYSEQDTVGLNAMQTIKEKFSKDLLNDELIKLYKRVK